MRRTVQSLALMLALSAPIYAGEMQCPVISPTPPSSPAVQGPTTDGEISTPLMADGIIQNDAAATFLQVVLNLLTLS
jgi:hypothetical protein